MASITTAQSGPSTSTSTWTGGVVPGTTYAGTRTTSGSASVGATGIPLTAASPAVTAGKWLKIGSRQYRVATGLGTGAGNVVIDAPGLIDAVSASASVSVDMVDDKVTIAHPGTNNASSTAYLLNGSHSAGATTINVNTGSGTILAGECIQLEHSIGTDEDGLPIYDNTYYLVVTSLSAGVIVIASPGLTYAMASGVRVVNCGHVVEMVGEHVWGDDTSTALNVTGTLNWSRSTSTFLVVRGQGVLGTGFGFSMGTVDSPIPAGVTHVVRLNDTAASPAANKWILGTSIASTAIFGRWTIFGAEKSGQVQLTQQGSSGQPVIRVDDVTGWVVGDRVMTQPASSSASSQSTGKIMSITGSGPYTVTLDTNLAFTHFSGSWVGNLSRNLIFEAANVGFASRLDGFYAATQRDNTLTWGHAQFVGITARPGSAGIFPNVIAGLPGLAVSRWRSDNAQITATQYTGLAIEAVRSSRKPKVRDLVVGDAGCFAVSLNNITNCDILDSLILSARQGLALNGRDFVITNTRIFGCSSEPALLQVSGAGLEVTNCEIDSCVIPFFPRAFGDIVFIGGKIGERFGFTDNSLGPIRNEAGAYAHLQFDGTSFGPTVTTLRPGNSNSTTGFGIVSDGMRATLKNKNGDVTLQERYMRYGNAFRDNAIKNRGTSTVRIETLLATGPTEHEFKIPAPPGETKLIGYVRKNSAYSGAAPTITVSGGNLVADVVFTHSAAADAWELASLDLDNPSASSEFTVTFRAYGTAGVVYFDGIVNSPWVTSCRHYGYQLLPQAAQVADSRITLTEAAALALPIAVDHGAGTITITGSATAREVFEHCIADLCQTANQGKAVHISSATGDTFSTTYTVVGAVVGPYTDAAGLHVSISAAAIVSGSRVQLYNVTDASELLNTTLGSTGLTYATTWTADKTIRLRADHADYLPLETTGILSSAGLTFLSEQAEDTVYVGNGIDGSTVTEFTADGLAIHADVDDPDGYTLVQRLYAWLQHYQTTSAGIASAFFGAMVASDSANYVIDQDKADIHLDNVSASPLMIVGGYLTRRDGTTVIAATSGSIQMDPGRAYVAPGGAAITVPDGERVITMASSGAHYARG